MRYGGVIIADSVGMGKTYVALRMIADALARDWRVVVAVPATLRRKWRSAIEAAGAGIAGRRQAASAGTVTLTSHTMLSRIDAACDGRPRLVVVDEAHQFRNPRTARYRALARLTADAYVVLLTATPINNRAADLYWLLRLFLGDGALADAGVPDLRAALLERTREDDMLMRRAARAVVVRRTRTDYEQSNGNAAMGMRFPRRHPARAIAYEPDTEELELLAATERTLPSLRLSAFEVGHHRRTSDFGSTAMLVRYGLLKRAESSTSAFRASLLRLLRFLDAFAEAVSCGGYVRAGDMHVRDPLQLSLAALVARPLPRHADRARLHEDVISDRELVQTLLGSIPPKRSAKLNALEAILSGLGDSKCVVFTEYMETAEALFASLPREGTALLHGTRAALASGAASRHAVLEAFAPLALGATGPQLHARVRTLIATDVLAEGLDLQDANHCISYDLPWNPVRLMQRAGRIDRLGSPHKDVFVWYFEPRNEIERWIGLMRRIRGKLETISRAVGAEHGVVADSGIYEAAADSREREVDDVGSAQDGEIQTLRNLLERMPSVGSDVARCSSSACDSEPAGAVVIVDNTLFEDLLEIVRIAEPGSSPGGVLPASPALAASPGSAGQAPGVGPVATQLPTANGLLLLRRSVHGTAWVECVAVGDVGPAFPRVTHTRTIITLLTRLAELLASGGGANEPDGATLLLDALDATELQESAVPNEVARIADDLRASLLRAGGTAPPDVLARADRLLQRMQAGLPISAALAVRRLLRLTAVMATEELVDRLDGMMPARNGAWAPVITAALLVSSRAVTRASAA